MLLGTQGRSMRGRWALGSCAHVDPDVLIVAQDVAERRHEVAKRRFPSVGAEHDSPAHASGLLLRDHIGFFGPKIQFF